MPTITVTKGLIGVEDISFMAGGATTGETFARATSTGGSQQLHKLSAKAIPVEDTGTVWTGTDVESVLLNIQAGDDAITLKSTSVITGFQDGSANQITVPTNNMAAARLMLGNTSTIIWMYLNAAPPGWKILTTGEDTVLGVKATAKASGTADQDEANHLHDNGSGDFVNDGVAVGDVAYNITDGTSALVTAVAATDLTLASDAFPDGNEAYEVGTRFVDPGGNVADEGSWDLCGQDELTKDAHTHATGTYAGDIDRSTIEQNVGLLAQTTKVYVQGATGSEDMDVYRAAGSDADNQYPLNTTVNIAGSSGAQNDPNISSDSLWRPAASLGRLFQLDTA